MHSDLDLRLLRAFICVVDDGSVTAAAERLRLSQPALSRQVKELERRLQVRLFDRSPTSLRLTAAGTAFVPLARDLLERAHGLATAARNLATGEAHRFRVVCPEATVRGVVAPFVASTGAPIWSTTISIASDAYERLLRRDVDLAINTLPPPATLASELTDTAPLWVYFAAGHRFGEHSVITAEDLREERLIVLAPGTGLRQVIDAELWPIREQLTIVAEPESSDLAIALAASGQGVCIDLMPPAYAIERRPFVRQDGSRARMPVYAAWEADHFAADEITALVASLTHWNETRTDY
ncbi:LysR family transcriptional regulator [Leucobacter chromiireducens]|uniref:LysR family transcriptional regulator n=1 Tax=Leucobacter chromiireducens subsp. solipictus TaxID=398235 RepID=A0ABS1SHL3_9MICO|nr:LysR family transcriptional regulator [Leucobacter chromiireducens]MBL3679822.1 LysR family transcriptional regulator [Leucobacter chromiireducens subsp. solipictus]